MKTKLLLALSLLFMMFATSCNFTENITINEDGSGVMSVEMDGSELMQMAGEELAKEKQEKIDSTIVFREIFKEYKDSIAALPEEQRDILRRFEKMEMNMLMDTETREMNIGLKMKFEKASELSDMMKSFSDLRKLQGSDSGRTQPDLGFDNENSRTDYFYDGKKFKKTVVVESVEEKDDSDKKEDMYKDMFASSSYTLNYKFPEKIKSVSDKRAVVGEDKKTLTLKYSLSDYMDNPEKMSIEVEFE
ncbi:MAG: hypothetical protein BM557_04730 [Flavobacterium sp. MedPE-SWcel]|uniref:hypothetical protein n=1 Tax=uncultured Flavobacterium sp. TaxID=165435 RepID=UPI000910CD98|nr:hypothetical protein [uncultured Flavobacterium sp.]OIQ21065.1 MAG: hypothetical protein BM557_04730 [Flavobacterium sp. MedPE-SWcel]